MTAKARTCMRTSPLEPRGPVREREQARFGFDQSAPLPSIRTPSRSALSASPHRIPRIRLRLASSRRGRRCGSLGDESRPARTARACTSKRTGPLSRACTTALDFGGLLRCPAAAPESSTGFGSAVFPPPEPKSLLCHANSPSNPHRHTAPERVRRASCSSASVTPMAAVPVKP